VIEFTVKEEIATGDVVQAMEVSEKEIEVQDHESILSCLSLSPYDLE